MSIIVENKFEISVRGLNQIGSYKIYAQKVANEISKGIGFDPEVKILVEPASKGKGVFSVSIYVDTNGESFAVHKKGKRIYSLLKQAKKIVIKMAREHNLKRIKRRRKRFDWSPAKAV